MWIDRVVELKPRERLVAIKNISLAEEHLHDHFEAEVGVDGAELRAAQPVMPMSLVVEGMAQTAGILVGHADGFREKVILAKVGKAELDADPGPGDQLRYTATVQRMSEQGAATAGLVECRAAGSDAFVEIGRIDLVFSHLDQNAAGVVYPEHNFVFGESFKTLLVTSGIEIPA